MCKGDTKASSERR